MRQTQRLAADEARDARGRSRGRARARSSRWRSGSQESTVVDHAVPVDQEVEGDDRRDDEKREDAEERLPAGPEARQEGADPGRALPDEVADRALHVGERLRRRRAAR